MRSVSKKALSRVLTTSMWFPVASSSRNCACSVPGNAKPWSSSHMLSVHVDLSRACSVRTSTTGRPASWAVRMSSLTRGTSSSRTFASSGNSKYEFCMSITTSAVCSPGRHHVSETSTGVVRLCRLRCHTVSIVRATCSGTSRPSR